MPLPPEMKQLLWPFWPHLTHHAEFADQISPQTVPWSETNLLREPPALEPLFDSAFLPQRIVRTVELFQNERYSPRLGFSFKSLLLLDRDAISNAEGTMCFTTVAEASALLLSPGWRWTSDEWEVQSATGQELAPMTSADRDNFGWLCNVDFSSYSATNLGMPTKSMTHFVRRRRIVRTQVFDEYSINDADNAPACQHCDLRAVDRLVPLFLEKLLLALHIAHKNKGINARNLAVLKSALMQMLLAPDDAYGTNMYIESEMIQKFDRFVAEQISKSGLSRVPAIGPMEQITGTGALVLLFPLAERQGLARAVIRHFDRSHQYHCGTAECGSRCDFAVHACPNTGCAERFSRRHWDAHDAVCPFKIVQCPLTCGELVVRNEITNHAAQNCVRREVTCPYNHIGCAPSSLLYCQVQEHCQLNHAYHLSLAMRQLHIVQAEKNYLQGQVSLMQGEVARLRRTAKPSSSSSPSLAAAGMPYY